MAHAGLTQLDVVGSMHERKARMADLADGFIALPGGAGTLEEIAEVWTWAQLGLHPKPIGFLNVAGYFDHLFAFIDHAVAEAFVKPVACRHVAARPPAGPADRRHGRLSSRPHREVDRAGPDLSPRR